VSYSAESACALLLCPPDTAILLVWATNGIWWFFSLWLCLRSPRGATDVNDVTWSMKLYFSMMNKTRHNLSIIYFESLGK
jgi:hypothetical protein